MEYFVWGLAMFFAASWTFGLIMRPDFRLKSTIVTIAYWWLIIGLAILASISVYHLFWLMPVALLVPMLLMQVELSRTLRVSVGGIFIKSLFIIGPAIGAVIYLA